MLLLSSTDFNTWMQLLDCRMKSFYVACPAVLMFQVVWDQKVLGYLYHMTNLLAIAAPQSSRVMSLLMLIVHDLCALPPRHVSVCQENVQRVVFRNNAISTVVPELAKEILSTGLLNMWDCALSVITAAYHPSSYSLHWERDSLFIMSFRCCRLLHSTHSRIVLIAS